MKAKRKSSKANFSSSKPCLKPGWRSQQLDWAACLILGLLIFTAYSSSITGEWQFDDIPNIVNNRNIQMTDLSWSSIHEAMTSKVGGRRPVSYLSFGLNYYFSGLSSTAFHVINLFIHWANAILVFLFLQLIAKRFYSHLPPWYLGGFSFFATALWACNPVQTQAVIYIIQRMAMLSSLFLLLTLLFYWKMRFASILKDQIGYLLASLFSLLLSLGSKENAFIFPALILSMELLFFVHANHKRFFLFLGLALPVLAAFAHFVFRHYHIQDILRTQFAVRGITMPERVLTESRIVLYYLSQLLLPLPSRLAVKHEVLKSTSLFSPLTTFFSMLIVVALISIALWQWRKRPVLSFGILWYFLNHLIESSIFPLELMFEHRSYFPSIGFFLVVLLPLLEFGSRILDRKSFSTCGYILAVLLGCSMVLTFQRGKIWEDEISLWQDNVEKYPQSYWAQNNLGSMNESRGDLTSAESHYRMALLANPRYPVARANLAILLSRKGQEAEALHLLKEVEESSLNRDGIYAFGLIYSRMGEQEKALEYYRRACNYAGPFPQAYFNLGLLCVKLQRYEEARQCLTTFLGLWVKDPNDSYVKTAQRHLASLSTLVPPSPADKKR